MLVAHRGGSLLAPENTMVAFSAATNDWWADMLEMDVRLTRDGHVVVIHDDSVDRTTDGSGKVSEMTLEEIQDLDAGYCFRDLHGCYPFRGTGVTIPTLDEVLEAFRDVWINIEAKEPQVAGPLYETLLSHSVKDRVLIAAEFEANRNGARSYTGPWGASTTQGALFWALHWLPGGSPYVPGADILQVSEFWKGLRVVTPRFVREAHRLNLPVQVWTVNGIEDMRRLLAWGVDGIQTDRPDLLSGLLTELQGRPVPPGSRESG